MSNLPDENHAPDDEWVPSVDACCFCTDCECDGVGCIAGIDADDPADHDQLGELHALLRAGHAWRIATKHGMVIAEQMLANAENRDVSCTNAAEPQP